MERLGCCHHLVGGFCPSGGNAVSSAWCPNGHSDYQGCQLSYALSIYTVITCVPGASTRQRVPSAGPMQGKVWASDDWAVKCAFLPLSWDIGLGYWLSALHPHPKVPFFNRWFKRAAALGEVGKLECYTDHMETGISGVKFSLSPIFLWGRKPRTVFWFLHSDSVAALFCWSWNLLSPCMGQDGILLVWSVVG